MKKILLDILVCPVCLPEEHSLNEKAERAQGDDIISGCLKCPACGSEYLIADGIALLDPARFPSKAYIDNKYETLPVISSYLWSHYGDLLKEENASDAYSRWSDLMRPHEGLCIDAGSAVGRFSFEMTKKCDFVIGVDNARSLIGEARDLMLKRRKVLTLKEEGHLTRNVEFVFPENWDSEKVEFIVADALALPIRAHTASSLASLNLVDKVPLPLRHLEEMNRVTKAENAQFLISDPFSWSEDVALEQNWLGGQKVGPYRGRGQEHIMKLLVGDKHLLQPAWSIESFGQLWWKIRTHANHYEQIRSCYIKAIR
ncbi:MAG: SAM-dependent methyltransferase [Syntrophaceae bacterium]|nr:SAM-dependent methyltransferase [Syntrophaceae bacterium]